MIETEMEYQSRAAAVLCSIRLRLSFRSQRAFQACKAACHFQTHQQYLYFCSSGMMSSLFFYLFHAGRSLSTLSPLQYKSSSIRTQTKLFSKTSFVLQGLPYHLLKDQVGLQNKPTLRRCNNDIPIALKQREKKTISQQLTWQTFTQRLQRLVLGRNFKSLE